MSRWTLRTAVSIKLAGRNRFGCSCTCSFSSSGFSSCQSLLQVFGHRMGVGPELALDHQEHAGLAVNGCGADRWGRTLDHARDVTDAHGAPFAIGEQFARDVCRRLRLRVGLYQDVLIGGFHEARAGHTGRLSARRRPRPPARSRSGVAFPGRPGSAIGVRRRRTRSLRRPHSPPAGAAGRSSPPTCEAPSGCAFPRSRRRPSTVLAEEVSGVMVGTMPRGSWLASAARRSAVTWRLR